MRSIIQVLGQWMGLSSRLLDRKATISICLDGRQVTFQPTIYAARSSKIFQSIKYLWGSSYELFYIGAMVHVEVIVW